MGGIIAFLVALGLTLALKLRAVDRGGLEKEINLLRIEVGNIQEGLKIWLQRVEDRLNVCQARQQECPIKYVTQVALNSFMSEIRAFHDKLDLERRNSWKMQDEINKRQELLNIAFYKTLGDHSHHFKKNMVGKPIGVLPIIDKL